MKFELTHIIIRTKGMMIYKNFQLLIKRFQNLAKNIPTKKIKRSVPIYCNGDPMKLCDL